MTPAQIAEMYNKGYRYVIHITANNKPIEPLFVKSSANVGPLMRYSYPHGTITKVENVNADGTLTTRDTEDGNYGNQAESR